MKKKKKYIKPEVSSGKVFESAALGCQKCTSSQQPIYNAACAALKRRS